MVTIGRGAIRLLIFAVGLWMVPVALRGLVAWLG